MAGVVVDASVAVKWFLDEDRTAAARSLLDGSDDLLAPSFILLEVSHAMWVAARQQRTTVGASEASEGALILTIRQLTPVEDLIVGAAMLMRALDHPVYDCLYLALAQREAATLITADEGQFRAARRAKIAARLL